MFGKGKIFKSCPTDKSNSNESITSDDSDVNMCQDIKLDYYSLQYIFKFLPIVEKIKMELVCRDWQAAALASWLHVKKLNLDSCTWTFTTKNFNNKIVDIKFSMLKCALIKCGQYLEIVDIYELLDGCESYKCTSNECVLKLLSDHCQNVIDISFKICCVEGFLHLSKNFYKIKNLRVAASFSFDTTTAQFDMSFNKLLKNNEKSIESLLIVNISWFKFSKSLNLVSLKSLIIQNFDYLCTITHSLANLLLNLERLETFELVDKFTDIRMILVSLSNCKNLTYLHLDNRYPGCVDKELGDILFTCTKLRVLHLFHIAFKGKCFLKLSYDSINELIIKYPCNLESAYLQILYLCKNLKVLLISNYNSSDGNISESMKLCTSLTKLVLVNVNFSFLTTVGKSLITDFRNLVDLKVSVIDFLNHNYYMNADSLFIDATQNLIALEKIEIELKFFSDAGLRSLGCLKRLKSLCIGWSKKLTGQGLSTLLGNVEVLKLISCDRLQESYLFKFLKNSLRIRRVDVIACKLNEQDLIVSELKTNSQEVIINFEEHLTQEIMHF